MLGRPLSSTTATGSLIVPTGVGDARGSGMSQVSQDTRPGTSYTEPS